MTNLTQTGKTKRDNYFQTGNRYYDALDTDWFSKVVDHVSMRIVAEYDTAQMTQPPPLGATTLGGNLPPIDGGHPIALFFCSGIDYRGVPEILPLRYLIQLVSNNPSFHFVA